MAQYTPFAPQRTQNATCAYDGEFEISPAKRRRVATDSDRILSAQMEVHLNPYIQYTKEKPASTHPWTQGTATHQIGHQLTIADRSAYDAMQTGWECENNLTAQDQHDLTRVTFETEFYAQYSTSNLHQTISIPSTFKQPNTYRPEQLTTGTSARPSSNTPPGKLVEANQVCFGMVSRLNPFKHGSSLMVEQVTDLRAELDYRCHQPTEVCKSVEFSTPSDLYISGSLAGKLDDRSAQILDVLSEDSLIDMQIILPVPKGRMNKRKNHASSQPQGWVPVSVILYGPESIAEDVGAFCQNCNLYLQDPVGCDRQNVLYRNPHRIASSQDTPRLAVDFNEDISSKTVTQLHYSGFLDALISSRSLYELQTPHTLITPLLSYALYLLSSCLFYAYTYTGTSDKLYIS